MISNLPSQSPNDTGLGLYHREPIPSYYFLIIIDILACSACIFGLVGNGTVIWFLGFRITRTPFTTLILNLAVADFGLLLAEINLIIVFSFGHYYYYYDDDYYHHYYYRYYYDILVVSYSLILFLYNVSQFLLATISIDRCVAILFPIWHRYHRPRHLSTILCLLIWVVFFLYDIIIGLIWYFNLHDIKFFYELRDYHFFSTALVCTPLILLSTLTLFIKACCQLKEGHRRKVIKAVLLTLLFFLIFAFPVNICVIVGKIQKSFGWTLQAICFLCGSLNSCVNPLIYFLVGRKKRERFRKSLKLILQRLFKEEEEPEEDAQPSAQTQQ